MKELFRVSCRFTLNSKSNAALAPTSSSPAQPTHPVARYPKRLESLREPNPRACTFQLFFEIKLQVSQ